MLKSHVTEVLTFCLEAGAANAHTPLTDTVLTKYLLMIGEAVLFLAILQSHFLYLECL